MQQPTLVYIVKSPYLCVIIVGMSFCDCRTDIIRQRNNRIKRPTKRVMCHPEIVKYITEQAAGAGDVVAKKMFGDYALYCNGKVVGMICDDELYLKPIPQTASLFREIRMQPPYEGAKPHYVLTDTDDRDYVALLVRTTADNLPPARSKRN